MLDALRSSHAWEWFCKHGAVAVEHLYLMEVAEDSGRPVILFQGEDCWTLVREVWGGAIVAGGRNREVG